MLGEGLFPAFCDYTSPTLAMPPRRTRPISTKRKLIFSCFTFMLAIAIAEMVCRLLGLGAPRRPADYIFDWDGPASWKLQWSSDFYVFDKDGEHVPSPINDDGLRDRPHRIERLDDLVRIVCLGDSVTFGYPLPLARSYPAIMETMIASLGRKVEVFNVSMPGWSIRQERIAYERIVRKYEPDVVILGMCLNDVAEMRNNTMKPPSPVVANLYRHSQLVRAVMRPHAAEIYDVKELFDHPNEPRVRGAWALCFAEIEQLARMVKEDDAELIVVLFPFRLQVEPDAPDPLPQVMVERFCRERGMRYVELLPSLRPLGPDGFVDYDHLSPQGAAVVARQMIESSIVDKASNLDEFTSLPAQSGQPGEHP